MNARAHGLRCLVVYAGLSGLLSAWACSPSAGGPSGAETQDPSSGGSGGSASGGSSSETGGSVSSSSGGIFIGLGGSAGSTLAPDAGCFATASKAESVEVPKEVTVTTTKPFDMFIMYDQSGSMNDETPSGTRWDAVKAALVGFVNSPTSADIGVGISYFPLAPPACNTPGPNCFCIPFINICTPLGGGSCNAVDYAKPDVGIEVLPAVATKIVSSVNAHRPGGGTPTTPALAGAHQYAKAWAEGHPDRKTIVVLATDGDPSGCAGNSVQDVAAVASSARAATPSVQTFVIGVGSSLTSLNEIAAAGGSGQALIVDASGGDPTKQFLDAMNKIRETVTVTETKTEVISTPVPCEWQIPAAPDGEEFDKRKVNVDFTPGGGSSQRIGAVSSAADCGGVPSGWHFDNAASPTKVLVCPQTCQTIQASTTGRVDVVFGCATEPAKVH